MTYAADHQLFVAESPVVSLDDRAFLYGDGLFETMICYDGKPRLWELHYARAKRGAAALQLAPMPDADKLRLTLRKLLEAEGLAEGWARARWVIWREEGGRYMPISQDLRWAMTAAAFAPKPISGLAAGLAKDAKVQFSPVSGFKTLSAMPYVLAGLEKKARNLEEILITGEDGQLAESLSANLFVGKGEEIVMPPAESGCVVGVMQQAAAHWLAAKGWQLVSRPLWPWELDESHWVMTANVAGFHFLTELETQSFRPPPQRIMTELETYYRKQLNDESRS